MLLQGEVFQPPGLLRSTEAVITARTLAAGDNGLFLVVTSGSGTIVADAATLGSGYKFGVYNSGSGSPTFDPTSTQTIRLPTGTVSTLAVVQGQGITFVSDGSNWLALLGIGFGPAPTATVTVYDNAFSILDNVDPTKIAVFQCSSITTGTTRTMTVPNADITIAGINLAQTWTAAQNFGTGTTVIATIDANAGAIDGTTVGAASPSTGAFTTLSATGAATLSGTQTVSGSAAPSILKHLVNTSYVSQRFYNDMDSGARSLEMGYSGSAYASSILTGAPTGEAGYITTTGNYPLLIGQNNTSRIEITNSSMTFKLASTFNSTVSVSGTTATISSGTGTPEAAVTAPVGSLFLRTDGGASTTLYVKESGAGNTGWVAK